MAMLNPRHILFIDEENPASTGAIIRLREQNYFVDTAKNCVEIVKSLDKATQQKTPYHAILLTGMLGRLEGADILNSLRRKFYPAGPVIGSASNPDVWKRLPTRTNFYQVDKILPRTRWEWDTSRIIRLFVQLGV